MAIAYVQTASNAGSSVTINGVTAGSLLVWSGSSGSPVTALSDSAGDTWTKIANDLDVPTALQSASMWYCKNASSGTHTVTRTGGFGSFEFYSITEYSGIDTTAPLDVYTSATNNINDPDSGLTGTTAQADELLVGCIANDSTRDNSGGWQNSFTSRGHGAGNSRALDWADRVVSATGTYRAKATSGGGQQWLALIATFKMASGGGGTPVTPRMLLLGAG